MKILPAIAFNVLKNEKKNVAANIISSCCKIRSCCTNKSCCKNKMLLRVKRSCCKNKVKYNTQVSWPGPTHDLQQKLLKITASFKIAACPFWGTVLRCWVGVKVNLAVKV